MPGGKKKGKKRQDRSDPESSQSEDERQQLLQGGACGISEGPESSPAKKTKEDGQKTAKEKRFHFKRSSAATSSRKVQQSDFSTDTEPLTDTGPSAQHSESESFSKKKMFGFFQKKSTKGSSDVKDKSVQKSSKKSMKGKAGTEPSSSSDPSAAEYLRKDTKNYQTPKKSHLVVPDVEDPCSSSSKSPLSCIKNMKIGKKQPQVRHSDTEGSSEERSNPKLEKPKLFRGARSKSPKAKSQQIMQTKSETSSSGSIFSRKNKESDTSNLSSENSRQSSSKSRQSSDPNVVESSHSDQGNNSPRCSTGKKLLQRFKGDSAGSGYSDNDPEPGTSSGPARRQHKKGAATRNFMEYHPREKTSRGPESCEDVSMGEESNEANRQSLNCSVTRLGSKSESHRPPVETKGEFLEVPFDEFSVRRTSSSQSDLSEQEETSPSRPRMHVEECDCPEKTIMHKVGCAKWTSLRRRRKAKRDRSRDRSRDKSKDKDKSK